MGGEKLKSAKPHHAYWLMLIVVVGFAVRLIGLDNMPFQHDEFSAIFRLDYNGLYDLVREGVALRDSHPAGVQIFLYFWKSLAGLHHFWWRLPFVLLGSASIVLIYLTASKLFGNAPALYAAAAMAVMQYFVYYSQMARPYIPAVFFLLWSFNLILEIRQTNQPGFHYRYFLLALSLALAAWIHHFAAFQSGLLFLAAFTLWPKSKYKNLLLVALMALLFYSPSIGVTITQLRSGSIGDWLGKPEGSFLGKIFAYTANFSLFFAASVIFAAMPVVKRFQQSDNRLTIRLLLVLFFALPLWLGWSYSIWRVPVLQYSTLIFGFPFLLIFMFSFGATESNKIFVAKVLFILITGLVSLIWQRQHIQVMQQQAFARAPQQAAADAVDLGNKFIFLSVSNTPAMFKFYLPDQMEFNYRLFSKQESMEAFMHCLDTTRAEYLGLAWADYLPYEWIAQARSVFGEVIKHYTWFNAEYYLLRRNKHAVLSSKRERLLEQTFFDAIGKVEGAEFALLFESQSLIEPIDDVMAVNVLGQATDTLQQLRLVLEFRMHPDSMPVLWQAGILNRKVLPGQSFALSAAWRFDSGPAEWRRALMRTYLWNPSHENFSINERRIWAATYDRHMFGLFSPI